MHEMGIAGSVLDAVRIEAARFPGARAKRVGLRIGEWAGVDIESLRFCLEALAARTDLSDLGIEIDYCERKNRCPACEFEFAVRNYEIACPHCGSGDTSAVSGTELDIAYVELED